MPFAPLPGPGTRIIPGSGADPLTGEVILLSGVGMAVRPSDLTPGGVILDGAGADPDVPAGLYVPDLATWPATDLALPGGSAYLTLLEALIAGAAPATGTDADNCYALRATGSDEGAIDLPLSTVDGRRFSLDTTEETDLARQSESDSSSNSLVGVATKFRPTADLLVTAAGTYNNSFSSSSTGLGKVVEILNDDRTEVLATSAPSDDSHDGRTWWGLPLLASIELQQGTDYWIGVRKTKPADYLLVQYQNSGGPSYTGSAETPDEPQTLVMTADALAAGLTWRDDPDGDLMFERLTVSPFQVLGGPRGARIAGTLGLEAITLGTPPNVPDQLNVRLQWVSA